MSGVRRVPRTWGTFWDYFGEKLVDLLDIQMGSKILDIGTGSGTTLYPAAKKTGSSGFVKGVELSEYWVDKTNSEIERCRISNAEVLLMDARKTTFPSSSFDCVIAGFIGWDDYFDFSRLESIKEDLLMKEIMRLLKSDGSFGLSTWIRQSDLDWMKWFLNSNGIDCRMNYSPENEEGWQKIAEDSGLVNLRFFTDVHLYTYSSFDAFWKEMLDYDWIDEQDDSEVLTEDLKSVAYDSAKEHMTGDGGVRFGRTALLMTAQNG